MARLPTWIEVLLLSVLAAIFVWRDFVPAWRSLNTDFPNDYVAARLYSQGDSMARVYDVATIFGITEGVVYYWIKHGQLHARQDDRRRWCVPFSVEVKETCRQWLLASTRIKPRTLDVTAGGAV